MLRFRLRPLAAFLEPVTSPLADAAFCLVALFGPWSSAVGYSRCSLFLRDVGGWVLASRNRGRAVAAAACSAPLRELACAGTAWLPGAAQTACQLARPAAYDLSAGTLLVCGEPQRAVIV